MLAPLHFALVLALAGAQDRFVAVPFSSISDELPHTRILDSRIYPQTRVFSEGHVALDGPGEAFLDYPLVDRWGTVSRIPTQLVVRAAGNGEIRGRVFLPAAGTLTFQAHAFTLPPGESDPAAKTVFHEVMERRYQRLLDSQAVGAPWFRHRIAEARAARGLGARPPEDPTRPGPELRADLDDTLDLFTGERALAENLDLDRGLRGVQEEVPSVDIASIPGVTTRALDWSALVEGLKPELDPLARFIPADQYAAFFPSFTAMARVIDELDSTGSPLVAFAATSNQDQRTKERYQEQLCLPLSGLSRFLGPAAVASIAITGGDPFLPSGSDIAVLFESPEPAVIVSHLALRHAAAKARGATPSAGEILGVEYTGVSTADRRISSYVARLGDTLVVTNSLVQLGRIASTQVVNAPALESAEEYVWFRERYPRGATEESAFLVLTDAAIRTWVGPRARIGESRRVRAAAAMAEVQARQVDALVHGRIEVGSSAADASLAQSSDFVWTPTGVDSPTWGNLGFLTPIAELEIEKATASEKRAYEAFRAGYEARWRTFFDPIALRLSVSDHSLDVDMTVMPLVAGTAYAEWIEPTRDATIASNSGDPHAGSLVHFVTSFSKESSTYQQLSFALGEWLDLRGQPDPLAWMGESVAWYADEDPFWDRLKTARESDRDLFDRLGELPVAMHVEVDDTKMLEVFMAAVRSRLHEMAPDSTHWEDRTWKDRAYVRIVLNLPSSGLPPTVHYVQLRDALVLTFREDILQRAIDRDVARSAGSPKAEAPPPWLGESVSLTLGREGWLALERLYADGREREMRRAAWLAVPILDEWKQRFPDEDPVRVHERLFGVRLVSPGGGTFGWNAELQTMEASDYGCPASPKEGPVVPARLAGIARGEFGLTFELDGLRARVKIVRE